MAMGGMGMGMGMQQPQTVAVSTVFRCPKCRQTLKEDPNAEKYDDIICDVCNKEGIRDCITCVRCNYDLCYTCAAVRS